jgi:hypothetical protein
MVIPEVIRAQKQNFLVVETKINRVTYNYRSELMISEKYTFGFFFFLF